jgi:hypothetical protein
MTSRVQPVDDELLSEPIHLDDDVDAASAWLDELIGAHSEPDPPYVAMTSLVDRIGDDDRLHRVEQVIESHAGVYHADLAVSLGWYDQAHFINDFRTMLGSTPGEYAATHGS